MKIFLKYIRDTKNLRWSTCLPFLFYGLFILVIFNLSFPLKSSKFIFHNFGVNEEDFEIKYNNKLNENKKDFLENSNYNNDLPEVEVNSKVTDTLLLRNAFNGADLNKDSSLSIQELGKYINAKIHDHIDNAIRNNPINFSKIDLSPKDGLISWEEYHTFFLRERGINEHYIRDHNEKNHEVLDRKSKETLMKDKALWAEAARSDPFSLTLDEFLSFTHPESSAANLLNLVEDLLRQFDEDGDDHLTVDEFSKVVTDDFGEGRKLIISKNVDERKMEFIRLIDKNNDKKADRSELLTYIDPRHPRHALQEAALLFSLSDTNKNLKLSIDEILAHSKIFLESKMIDASESFHDEF